MDFFNPKALFFFFSFFFVGLPLRGAEAEPANISAACSTFPRDWRASMLRIAFAARQEAHPGSIPGATEWFIKKTKKVIYWLFDLATYWEPTAAPRRVQVIKLSNWSAFNGRQVQPANIDVSGDHWINHEVANSSGWHGAIRWQLAHQQ